MISGLDNVENFGIDLKLESEEEEEFYSHVLRGWFEEFKGYHTILVNNTEFDLVLEDEPIATVYIEHSILRMKSIKDDPYEILICLLEFIAENHKKTIQAFNYLEEEDSGLPPLEQEDTVENDSSEEDSDEDSEWI